MSTEPITLRRITADTVRAITDLTVADDQKGFVASNAISLAQALFAPEAWYRAIYLGEQPAGFVMLHDEALRTEPPAKPEVSVWRFMIDQRFQRHGIGRTALALVIEHVKTKGLYDKLELSYVPGPGCPEPFYRSLGFVPNGRMDGDEIVLELAMQASVPASSRPPADTQTKPLLHHLSFPVTDLALSGAFYDAALGALGFRRVFEDDTAIGYGRVDGEDEFCLKLRPAVTAPGPGFHLAFAASAREAVDRFHAAALAVAGTDKGAPGLRPDYGPHYYAAFLLDPDGHHIEAVINNGPV